MTTESEHPVSSEDEAPAPETTGRRRFLKQAAGAAAVGIAAASVVAYVETRGAGTAAKLVSAFRGEGLPIDDPLSSVWLDLDYFAAKMVAQNITTPVQATVEVPEVRVRSLHDGKTIAFHLEWNDSTEDDTEGVAVFRDAVAVMLEVDPQKTPSFTMGNVDGPVHIVQWRASWQKDIDHGYQGLAALFPNAFNDVNPEKLMPKEQAVTFYPARVAGNTNANHDRTTPVEELTAIGFGSLTPHDKQLANGRGEFKSRRWEVVIALPMASGDSTKAQVKVGETRNVAFAVWNGSKAQRGGRKQYFPWTPMEVEAAR